MNIITLLFTFLISISFTSLSHAQKKGDLNGYWVGEVSAFGQTLEFFTTITVKDNEITAKLDIPAQNQKDIPGKVTFVNGVITIRPMKDGKESPTVWTGKFGENKNEIVGTVLLNGVTEVEFKMMKQSSGKNESKKDSPDTKDDREIIAIAMYTVKKDKLKDFPTAKNLMYTKLTQMDGYISGEVFEAEENESLFMGYYTYASLTHSQNASKVFPSIREADDYRNSVDTYIMYDLSYSVKKNNFGKFKKPKLGDYTELNIYNVEKDQVEDFVKAHTNFTKKIASIKGIKYFRTTHSILDNKRFLEYILWDSKTNALNGKKKIEKLKEFKNVSKYSKIERSDYFKTKNWKADK